MKKVVFGIAFLAEQATGIHSAAKIGKNFAGKILLQLETIGLAEKQVYLLHQSSQSCADSAQANGRDIGYTLQANSFGVISGIFPIAGDQPRRLKSVSLRQTNGSGASICTAIL